MTDEGKGKREKDKGEREGRKLWDQSLNSEIKAGCRAHG